LQFTKNFFRFRNHFFGITIYFKDANSIGSCQVTLSQFIIEPDLLQFDDKWKDTDFDFIGFDLPDIKEKKPKKEQKAENIEFDFYRSKLNDCIYESNNEFEMPHFLYFFVLLIST